MPPCSVPIGLAWRSRSVSSSKTARPGSTSTTWRPINRAMGGGGTSPCRMRRPSSANESTLAAAPLVGALGGLLIETHGSTVSFSPQPTGLDCRLVPAYALVDPSACSIARALGVLGDTWSLLVLCELFLGVHCFE